MTSPDRRTLITGALSAAALPRVASARPLPSTNVHFNIFRNGKPFGQYNVAFASSGDFLTVTSDAAMSMQVAGLTVFDYRHHCEEVWRGGQFMQLQSRTVRDRQADQAQTVNATRANFDIHMTTNKGPLSAPLSANPLTHWNMAVLGGPVFNPQDGLMLDLTARPVGRSAVGLANGTQLNASHWTLRGSQTLDEWYDDSGVWAGLRALFPDQSVIEYRRT
jgi:hypothetical protein